MAVARETWVGLMATEYLDDFVPAGGGAVRFVVAEAEGLDHAATALAQRAATAGLRTIRVTLAETKLHMLHHFFFAVARQLPWEQLLQARVEALVVAGEYRWPRPGAPMTLNELAEANGITAHLLHRQLLQWLTAEVWHDAALAQDFRKAMIAALENTLTGENVILHEAVLDWLRGDLRRLATVRAAAIGSRIGRHNARAMLTSLFHFLRGCGAPGVLVLLDIRRLHQPGRGEGVSYTPAGVMDCYEVLRQIIDDTEHFPGLFLAVLADDALLGDSNRALGRYDALKMRLFDDVPLRGRDNPMAPLVRLGS